MSSPLPPAAAYEALARQAHALAGLLRDRGRASRAAFAKAHEALRFSATAGARSLAVPSKLVGVRAFQSSLAALSALRPPFGLRLDLVREGTGRQTRLVVRVAATAEAGPVAGATLGAFQAKHRTWLVDLLPLGVEARLTRVTGVGSKGLMGCNVAFTGVGAALARLARCGFPDPFPGGPPRGPQAPDEDDRQAPDDRAS